MKTVIVKKSLWHTQGGRTLAQSALRSSSSKRMCCLGFAAQQAGCKNITDIGTPIGLHWNDRRKFETAYPKIDVFTLIKINDNKKTTRAQKAAQITEAGKSMGINFVFI